MILLILSFLFVPSLISHRSCFDLGNAPTWIMVSRWTGIVDDQCAAVSNSQDPIHDTYNPVIRAAWVINGGDRVLVSNSSYLASQSYARLATQTFINTSAFIKSITHSLYLTPKFFELTWASECVQVQPPRRINTWCFSHQGQRWLSKSTSTGFDFITKAITKYQHKLPIEELLDKIHQIPSKQKVIINQCLCRVEWNAVMLMFGNNLRELSSLVSIQCMRPSQPTNSFQEEKKSHPTNSIMPILSQHMFNFLFSAQCPWCWPKIIIICVFFLITWLILMIYMQSCFGNPWFTYN